MSNTSGAPGTAVTITGTGCTSTDDADRSIVTNLITGTAPNERLAGQTETYDGSDDEAYPLIVPSWPDPTQPAVLEATCFEYSYEGDNTDAVALFSYDPVPFDILAGPGAAQVATASRTTASRGQAIKFTLTDCTSVPGEDDGPQPTGYLYDGTDLSGRTLGQPVAYGESGVDDDGPGAFLLLSAFDPGALPDGNYAFVPSCVSIDGTLGYEPQVITISGTKPVDQISLITDGTSTIALAGKACTAGDVQVDLIALDLSELPDFPVDGFTIGTGADARVLHRTKTGIAAGRPARAVESTLAPAPDPDFDPAELETTATPDADGNWSTTWNTGIEKSGFVIASAICGDPLGDGFFYDTVGRNFTVTPPPTTTAPATTAPATAPAAPTPAVAVAGRPNYAG